MTSNAATCPSRNASCAWLAYTRWQARPEQESRKANMKHRDISPARSTITSPKSTSASAPGSLACGTNPATLSPRARSCAAISARRRCTCLATYEYETRASCSSCSRSKTRLAVCRCLRGASRSSRSMSSISLRTSSSTGAARAGTLRSGGTAETSAWRTVRRCTSYFRASARTDIWLRCQSKRIAANSSTLLDPIPAPPDAEEHPIRPTIHPGIPPVPQPPGVSPRRSATAGPNQSATPPPRPPPDGARSKENSGATSECYSHGCAIDAGLGIQQLQDVTDGDAGQHAALGRQDDRSPADRVAARCPRHGGITVTQCPQPRETAGIAECGHGTGQLRVVTSAGCQPAGRRADDVGADCCDER